MLGYNYEKREALVSRVTRLALYKTSTSASTIVLLYEYVVDD